MMMMMMMMTIMIIMMMIIPGKFAQQQKIYRKELSSLSLTTHLNVVDLRAKNIVWVDHSSVIMSLEKLRRSESVITPLAYCERGLGFSLTFH